MALLEGRIIGQIAKEHLGHDHAVLGPSPVVTIYRQGFYYMDSSCFMHWDDRLIDNEISCICCLYCCYTGKKIHYTFIRLSLILLTGNGPQMSEVLWWLTPMHWNSHNPNCFNWGHWTDLDKVWYQQRVKNILSGHKTGVLLTQTTWQSNLKGAKPWREVTKHVQDGSKAFF